MVPEKFDELEKFIQVNHSYEIPEIVALPAEKVSNKYLDCNENIRGFGGMCLPKDTSAISALVKELGLNIDLFQAVVDDNKNYKTTVFEGMRK
jgi:UDP-glucose 6-dehydrogenase